MLQQSLYAVCKQTHSHCILNEYGKVRERRKKHNNNSNNDNSKKKKTIINYVSTVRRDRIQTVSYFVKWAKKVVGFVWYNVV